MSVFDNIIEKDGKIFNNQWVEWVHLFIPNKPKWFREFMRTVMRLFSHCLNCSAVDGCYFIEWNIPKNVVEGDPSLLHPKCDCSLRYIDYSQVERNAKAECSIDKFENYIFVEKSKKSIFENLGYKIQDSAYLVDIFKNQAVKQYLKGNYKLKKLDRYGQRLAIPIILKEKSFYSGWMLQPEGELVNTTPFGGKINEK